MPMENLPEVVSSEEWLAARRELLAQEKELTRLRDRVNADRRRLPMVRVDKPYTFVGPDGPVSLLDLFDGRRQLVMHHFMWLYDVDDDGTEHPRDTGCPSCASAADQIPSHLRQLHVRGTTLVAVSRAPYETIAAYQDRMGWTFPWYSSFGTDFNYDFHTSIDPSVAPVLVHYRTEEELAEAGTPWGTGWRTPGDYPGISAFLRVDDDVFHTYSAFGRGIEGFHYGIPYLDLTALGRQEEWEEPRGRATPLGLQVGSPGLRLPDEYGVDDGADEAGACRCHEHGH
ncbi:DUF899 domain-containing protein [Promicromonospora thailandica]|uniref:Dithiol-disulfide oxidoreductase, DUF899 family n=1 Tax=Promicromonospora thailandica TaxID=765201 RepID=A0A9X2JUK3_9MICO|nr:DUF899 domain-containing protein [Promicromonospora thailandica]MCP2264600.1 putative dithiol-disulfide oxidoreductase, DUF899 family [Promicromonospora thailandica]